MRIFNRITLLLNRRKETLLLILIPLLLIAIVFRKYLFEGLLPIPGDIIPGLYFPWFDYKWGYATPVPVKNNLPSDIVSILYPWRIMGINIIKNGHLPLWDSSILLGTPLLANFQSSLLNPFNLLFLIIPVVHAWSAEVVLQPILMITTMYVFLRSFKLSRFPSLLGGILYAFSGYTIVWMEYNSINYTLFYFPLILWSVKKISEGSGKAHFVMSLFVALQLLSGYPLNTLFTIVYSFIFLIYQCLNKNDSEIRDPKNKKYGSGEYKLQLLKYMIEPVRKYVVAVFLGLGLASVQLIPSLELQSLSIRNYDTVASASGVKYLPLNQVITMLVPDFYGNPGTGNYWGSGSFDNFAFSISAVGIYFSVIYFLVRKRRVNTDYFYLFTLVTVLVFVTENTVSVLINNLIPSFASNVNTRALFIISFVLSVFAAWGFELSLKKPVALWKKFIPIFVYMVVLFILFFNLYRSGDFPLSFKNILTSLKYVYQREELNMFVAFKNTIFPFFTVTAVFFAMIITKMKQILGIILIFVILIFSVSKSTDKYMSFTRKDLMYPDTPAISYLKESLGNGRFGKERKDLIFPSNTWSLYGLGSVYGQNASSLLSISKYFSILNSGDSSVFSLTRYTDVWNTKSPLYSTLNVSHYLTLNWDEDKSPSPLGKPIDIYLSDDFEKEIQIESVSIFKNKNNLGSAWFPESVVCDTRDENIFKELVRADYEPESLVFVNCTGDNVWQKGDNDVTPIESGENFMVYRTNADIDSYLTISSAYYPGWEYYVDENNMGSVYKANSALTAVWIPKGEHTVKLIYDPVSFKIGLIISGISLFVWSLLMRKTIKI